MDARHNAASEMSEADKFASLCGLTGFVTNSKRLLTINWSLTPDEVSVLISLLSAGTGLSHLDIREELPPNIANQLGAAINCSSSTIRELFFGRYKTSGIKQAPELLRVLAASANPSLEQIRMQIINMSDALMLMCCVCGSLGKCTGLRGLTIYATDQFLTQLGVTEIGKLQALESLKLQGVKLFEEDVTALVATLKALPWLTELEIRDANIKEEAARTIGGLVALGRIRKLDLCFNQFGCNGVFAIVDAILVSAQKSRCKLQKLNLGDNDSGLYLRQEVMELLATPQYRAPDLFYENIGKHFRKLRAVRTLEKLEVNHCGLGVVGIESLLDATSFPKLRVLRIGRNLARDLARDLGAGAVSRFLLASPCALSELQIQNNCITDYGALGLATALTKAYALKSLYMTKNLIGPRGAAAIVDALITASMVPMDTIDFAECEIKDDGASAVGRLISRRGCIRVYLSTSYIHAKGAKAIANSVAKSKFRTQVLDLEHNVLGDEAVKYLLDKVTQPPDRSVRKLNIIQTGMGVKGAMAAKRAVERAVETSGVLRRLRTGVNMRDEDICRILQKVEEWESDSRPPGTAILVQSNIHDFASDN